MSNRLVIGVGGSGAKVLESVLHLCAAGLGPTETWVGLVDQDQANGNGERTQELLHLYRRLQGMLSRSGDTALPDGLGLLATHVTAPATESWCPLPDRGGTLENLFHKEMLKGDLRQLMDVLYDPEAEQRMDLQEGFRGRPGIGAAVMIARAGADADHPFWRGIRQSIAEARSSGAELRICLAGSVFGGTGAAGLPILARLIRRMAENEGISERVRIGGCLMLPYFAYAEASTPDGTAATFVDRSQAALQYYPKLIDEGVFDTLYLIGLDRPILVSAAGPGAREQRNPALLPELLGGLAAIDFLSPPVDGTTAKVKIAVRGEGDIIGWGDLPLGEGGGAGLAVALGQWIRFCVLFRRAYGPLLLDKRDGKWKSEPWFRTLVRDQGVTLGAPAAQGLVSALNDYAAAAMEWMGSLCRLTPDGLRTSLVDTDLLVHRDAGGIPTAVRRRAEPFSDPDLRAFAGLVVGAAGRSLAEIYDFISEKPRPITGQGLGILLGRLYLACRPMAIGPTAAAGGAAGSTASSVFLLPPMRRGANVPAAPRSGCWQPMGREAAVQVANGLEMAEAPADLLDLVSIPDVWAQVELFRTALLRDDHPLFGQARDEWRGLLTCIALIPIHYAEISTSPLSLTALAAQPFEMAAVALDKGELTFAAVAEIMPPTGSMLDESAWNDVAVITADGIAVGLVVPSLLVCPGRGYARRLAGRRLPWLKAGRFTDPCGSGVGISAEELLAIARYCKGIVENLGRHTAADRTLFNRIVKLLRQFEADATQAAQARARGPLGITFDDHPVALPLPAGLAFLRKVYRLGLGDGIVSDCRVVLPDSLAALIKGVVLVDPAMATTQPAGEIRVWATTALSQVLGDADRLAAITAAMAEAGVLCLTPDLVFTPRLCKLFVGGFTTHPEGFVDHLLPLTPLALALFGDTVAQRLRKAPAAHGGVMVTLTIELIDREGHRVLHSLERVYPSPMVIEPPATIAVWPNVTAPNWPWNFLFTRFNRAGSLAGTGLAGRELVAAALAETAGPRERVESLLSLAAGTLDLSPRHAVSRDASTSAELYFLVAPARALMIRVDPADAARRDPVVGGLIVLPERKAVEPMIGPWRVGIDFGTTNTCLYRSQRGQDPEPLPILSRSLSPFLPTGPRADLDNDPDFLPFTDLVLPFMTVMQEREGAEARAAHVPVWSFALFDVVNVLTTLRVHKSQNTLKFNLKWEKLDEGGAEHVHAYLTLLVLHACVEALNAGIRPETILWSFTYPQTFQGDRLRSFKTACRSAVAEILSPDDPGSVEPDIRWVTESEASALYFSHRMGAGFNGTILTIDIGGQSSDVSIWQDRRMLWHNSVDLAGRHILINFLCDNPHLLTEMGKQSPDLREAIGALAGLPPGKMISGVEVLVNTPTFGALFDRLLSRGKDYGLDPYARLALSGLLFYSGGILSHLDCAGLLAEQRGMDMKLCFGGRASKLFRTLFPDLEDEGWVTDMLAAGGSPVEGARPVFSSDPKHECAYGQLVEPDPRRPLDTRNAERTLILGETILVDGIEVDFSVPIGILPEGREWSYHPDLPRFAEFLGLARQHLGYEITVSPQARSDILVALDDSIKLGRLALISQRQGRDDLAAEAGIMSPPFIVILRTLLTRMTKGGAKIHDRR